MCSIRSSVQTRPALFAGVILMFTGTVSHASDSVLAEELLQTTGVYAHLSGATDGIFTDALPNYIHCAEAENKPVGVESSASLRSLIEKHFGVAASMPRATQALAEAMTVQELETVHAFFKSPVGVRVVAAEFASQHFDEKTFNERMDAYLSSAAWNSHRFELIEAVYDATRAARFVSTLNSEILVAGALAGQCNLHADELDTIALHSDMLRSESRFIEPLMRRDLLPVMATVFKDLTNQELSTYVEFSQSKQGAEFYDALLVATENGLSGGLLGLEKSLLKGL